MRRKQGLLLALVLFSVFAVGQQTTAVIVGTITDPTSAVIPQAVVTVTSLQTGLVRRTSTDQSGEYVILNLPIGKYRVEVEHPGFRRAARESVQLDLDQRARIDVQLQTGNVTESVNVLAEAPLLQTTDSSVGQVIASRTITELPLNGRNFYQLASLSPGVSFVSTGQPIIRSNYINVVMNGSRGHATSFLMDGVDTTEHHGGGTYVRPTVDAIEEFKTVSDNFSAQYGRSPSLITTAIKSGTNQLHGSIWEFLRNDKLNARNYFAQTPPPLKYNQFGAVLGGPIKRDRTFFFASYEGTRIREGLTFNTPLPSAAMRGGDFSALTTTIFDPNTTIVLPDNSATRDPFPGNVIPSDRLAPQALALLQFIPLPNNPGGTLSIAPSRATTGDQAIGRVDQRISDRDQIFVRYIINYDRIHDPNAFTTLSPIPELAKGQNVAVQYTRVFRPTLFNEFTLAYNRSRLFLDNSPNVNGTDYTTGSGISGFEQTAPEFPGLPYASIAGYGTLNDGVDQPKQNVVDSKQVSDNLSWVHSNHTFKTGFEYRRLRAITRDTAYNRGLFAFSGTFTQNPGSSANTGNGFADFLLGLPSSVTRSYPIETNGTFGNYYGAYAEDNWRVTRSLSLNLGLRYEYSPFFTGLHNVLAGFDPATGKIILPDPIDLNAQPVAVRAYPFYQDSIVTTSSLGLPSSVTPSQKTNFAPRVGFAWKPFGAQSTVIRGGWGVFWLFPINDILGNNFEAPPFILYDSALNNTPVPNRTLGDFFLGDPIPSAFGTPSISAAPIEGRNAYTNEWNLTVQHAVTKSLSIEASYVGQKGTHLQRRKPVNTPDPGPGPVQARRPFPLFSGISLGAWDTDSNYHSLQVKAEQRLARGLSFTASYAFSKSIDDNSNYFTAPLNFRNLRLDRGVSDFDIPHRFVASYVYELPWGRNSGIRNPLKTLIAGWQLSGIITVQSGLPFTPGVSGDFANIGSADRPNRIASGKLSHPTVNQWFDPLAFTVPQQYTFGNSGRNILRADGLFDWDLSASKNTHLTERVSLQFRAELFNLLNKTNFNAPVTTINAANAGRVLSAGDPRVVQFGLKLRY